MSSWRESILPPDATLLNVMQVLEKSALHFVMVADASDVLLGTVTDGDVRRALLRGLDTSALITDVMNPHPTVLPEAYTRDDALRLMQARSIRQLPVVGPDGRIVGVTMLEALLGHGGHSHMAVIMAGGQGRRLRPLTDNLPKPLLPVGGRPAVELVIESLIASGFRDIVLSVNYLADMIIDKIGDGARWGITIRYVRESQYLGTAGALRHVRPVPTSPFLVINADVMTRFDFRLLLDFHAHHASVATMCVRPFMLQVPYGVIRSDEQRLTGIEEKPTQTFLINAGIYLLDPSVLDEVPADRPFHMTALFERLTALGLPAHVFPLHEYWLDIGHLHDLQQANSDYEVK